MIKTLLTFTTNAIYFLIQVSKRLAKINKTLKSIYDITIFAIVAFIIILFIWQIPYFILQMLFLLVITLYLVTIYCIFSDSVHFTEKISLINNISSLISSTSSLTKALIFLIGEIKISDLQIILTSKLNSSSGNTIRKFLGYVFFMCENKEEIIGDLLEQDEHMKELRYSNFKRVKNMLIQIFMIKVSLIKTKIENALSMDRKIDKT